VYSSVAILPAMMNLLEQLKITLVVTVKETKWVNQSTRRKLTCHMHKVESYRPALGSSAVCQQVSSSEKERLESILKMEIHSCYIPSEEEMLEPSNLE